MEPATMIIGGVIDGLKQVIDFLKMESQINKEFFEKYIEPIYNNFLQLHSDYMDSFKRYREKTINSKKITVKFVEMLVDQIRSDSMLTAEKRNKLLLLKRESTKSRRYKKISGFLVAIIAYINCIGPRFSYEYLEAHFLEREKDFSCVQKIVMPRGALIDFLERFKRPKVSLRENVKLEILKEIDQIIDRIQQNYVLVESEYIKLKNKYFYVS
jgi:hypothetical protein